ncbi:MAG: chitobiase/beta-hexosaminidase C-terminal domain-containing protein [Bacteroidales bacterium]|nr:chitobiase/beta-hexosaminidase C-terminal domain-containing protein [Bacteroidales bacterium]
MKQNFKQWAWRTLLTLTCILTTTSAWADVTIYVNPSSANYYMHYWGTGITGTTWPGVQFSSDNFSRETIGTINWYKITFSGVNSVNCIFNQGSDQNKTSDITNISGTKFYTYNGGSSYSDVTSTYSPYLDNYYATGDNATVFGTAWSPTAKLMTNDYNGNWTWTSDEFQMNEGSTIGFKVVKNGTDWIPSGEGNETKKTAPATGTYKLKVTYVLGASASDGELIPIDVAPSAPVFSLASGTYDTNKEVTITTAGTGTIYYTTDGTDPETSETRIEYNDAISITGEGEHIIKAVVINGEDVSEVVTREYVIKYQNIYVFGSVGKAHTWVYDYTNPELITSDGINYSGVINVLNMPGYPDRTNAGLFMLTTGFGSNWETTQQYMIGATSDNNFWIDGSTNYLDKWVPAAEVGQSDKGWTIIPTNGNGTPYEFFYNKETNQFKLATFDGPTIYVYDYTRPYIYVEDADHVPYDGVQPGNPIQILDETVGGHSGLCDDADGSVVGNGTLGWYKFSVPSHNYPFHFQFHHNGDKKVIDSDFYQDNAGDVYYYWDGEGYQEIPDNSRANAANLRRIVAHVRVQGTTVPTCDGVAMNGPSSFYGQMYYWMAVTKYNEGANVVISDGKHHYEGTIYSDIYLEWTDENSSEYDVLKKTTLEDRLANKTGRGTVIHLLKNKNTPTNQGDYVLGIDTKISTNGTYYNTTNTGTTWWGNSLTSTWAGTESYHDSQNIISNYNNSRFLYAENGIGGTPDVYTITAENGTEWYTWYSDRSTATIKFGYGTPIGGYPEYITGGDNAPNDVTNVYKFYANYESPQTDQTAGEVWYVWTPDFDATLDDNNQSANNGTLLDVTRTYESRAKQKALCSTFRDGNYVYYTDIKGWGDDNVYCYVWPVNGIVWNDETSGVKMTKVGYDDEGHPVYLADLSNYDVSNATNIIFNNGQAALATDKRQTGDLPFENYGCYDYLGLLYRIGGNVDVIENEPDNFPTSITLEGVWYSRVKGTLFAKGDNDYNNKSENGFGYIDFAKTVNDGNEDGSVLQSRDYDQSNWVEISPSEDGLIDADKLISLIGKKFTLYGTKTNSVNPAFTAISISNEIPVEEEYLPYVPNHFTPIHFNGSPYQYRTGKNEWYFFVEPKPNEFAEIDWTIYHLDTSTGIDTFSSPSNSGFTASFTVDWSYHDPYNKNTYLYEALKEGEIEMCGVAPKLQDGGYKPWFAIIKYVQGEGATSGDEDATPKAKLQANDATAGKYVVCPIYLKSDMITAIDNINVDKRGDMRSLKSTRYYNMMGVESATPFEGVNIIVKEYSDGSRESSKAIMR